MVDRVGQQLGNYRLVRLLGRGAFAEVYLGQHVQLKTQAAIKVLATYSSSDFGERERFRREAHILSSLNHPHIVRFLELGIEGDTPFLVMDLALNGTLRQRHPQGSQLPLTTIIPYIKQITEALQYMHNIQQITEEDLRYVSIDGVIHKNIKPQAMLLGRENEILLGSFSIAGTIPVWTYVVGGYAGALAYMAPEQIKGYLDPASDQYALGVVVYEWLCGDQPFKAPNLQEMFRQHLEVSPPPLQEKVPSIPSAVEEVVMKALAKDPKQRFASVEAFADALEQAYLSSIRPKTPDRVGQQFGNYRLIRSLGHGGFADVYLGQHRRLNTYAAIKVLHTRLSNEDMEDFQKEAQTIANLRHLSIVRVLDFDVEGDTPFLVMDNAPNGTLRDRHPKGSRVPLTTIVSYVKQVAAALQYAHDQKLIHRDVKPENMLLGPNNEVLLSDFGIAAVAHSTASLKTQAYSGTVHYSAPEQISGKPRPASDQYALGIVVYEWLTGTRPFSGDLTQLLYQHISVPPPPLRGKDPTIPRAVEQVVMIALAKDPQRRFASVQAFATALEQASQQAR